MESSFKAVRRPETPGCGHPGSERAHYRPGFVTRRSGFLPGIASLAPDLFAKEFTNQGMRVELSVSMRIFSGKQSLLFLTWQGPFATRLGLNQLMILSGSE